MKPLEGKVAIVTGAGRMRGIGHAIVRRLADDGADVAVAALPRSPDSLAEHQLEAGWRGAISAAEEVKSLGRRALALDVDVADGAQVGAMIERTLSEFGRIDILVNSVGVTTVAGKSLWEVEEGEWLRDVEVNLHGVYRCCRAVAAALVEQADGGSIINIASLSARSATPGSGGYTAAKAGVVGLTRMLALELARYRVTVNAVCPGSIETDMMDRILRTRAERSRTDFDSMKEKYLRSVPLGRQGRPEEVAGVVAFLAGSSARYITGQSINVDGGTVMS